MCPGHTASKKVILFQEQMVNAQGRSVYYTNTTKPPDLTRLWTNTEH